MHTVDRLESVLCGSSGPRVLHALSSLAMGHEPDADAHDSIMPLLADLGMGTATASGFDLGDFGHRCADAAREYGFWVARQRTLHREGTLPVLQLSNFAGKRVLEIGPGWGCNLFRLQQVTPHVRGREIDEVYARLTPVFARLEGVTAPAIDVGGGEQLPYEDGSFDWVVMFSALQYMDLRAATREVARVLAPGGRFLSTQPTLAVLTSDLMRSLGEPRRFAHLGMTLLNSLGYGLLGRRVRTATGNAVTSRPVQLTPAQLVAIVEAAGLRHRPDLSGDQPRDYLLVADKPHAH